MLIELGLLEEKVVKGRAKVRRKVAPRGTYCPREGEWGGGGGGRQSAGGQGEAGLGTQILGEEGGSCQGREGEHFPRLWNSHI